MKIYKIFIYLILVLASVSCTKRVDFDEVQVQPLLVVNGLQRVGGTPNLCIEKSRFFLSNESDITVKGVQVKLFVNDEYVENLIVVDSMFYNDENYYETNYKYSYCYGTYVYQTGDRVCFEVSADDFESVTASVVMPDSPMVLGFDTTHLEPIYNPSYEDSPYSYQDVDAEGNPCSIDPIWEWDEDFENFEIVGWDTVYPGTIYAVDAYFDFHFNDPQGYQYYNIIPVKGFRSWRSSDPVFMQADNLTSLSDFEYYGNDERNLFSDMLFQGKDYHLEFFASYVSVYNDSVMFSVDFSCVDENYYKYIQSCESQENELLGEVSYLFGEPTQIYSNVEGGIGIVGAMSAPVRSSFTVKFHH